MPVAITILFFVFSAAPLFVVQWLFDEEQLKVENIYIGRQHMSNEQWQYIQNLGRELKNSLRDVTYVHNKEFAET